MDFPHSGHAQIVDMFALASSILRAARIRNAEKALRTETRATEVNLGLFFERKKKRKGKGKTAPVRIRYDTVPPRFSCQGSTAYTKRAKKTKGKQQSPFCIETEMKHIHLSLQCCCFQTLVGMS